MGKQVFYRDIKDCPEVKQLLELARKQWIGWISFKIYCILK